MKFLTDIFTENDGITICPGRVFLVLGLLVFLVLEIYSAFSSGKFDGMQFGTGYGSILGSGVIGIGFKARTDKV